MSGIDKGSQLRKKKNKQKINQTNILKTLAYSAGLSLRAGDFPRLLRAWPPATFVIKLNQMSTPLKHTKTIHQTK